MLFHRGKNDKEENGGISTLGGEGGCWGFCAGEK